MQYTCPDLICAANNLPSYTSAPYAPVLQVVKHLTLYLAGLPHCPIIYLSDIYGTTTHELHQEVYPGDFHSQNIPNSRIAFVAGG